MTARWMVGLPPILFGLAHFTGIRVFASIVPHGMGFGIFERRSPESPSCWQGVQFAQESWMSWPPGCLH